MYLLSIDVSLCGGNSFITGFRGDTKKWIGNTEQNKNTQRKSCSMENCTALWMWGLSLGQRKGDDISTFVSLGYDVVVVQFGGCLQNTLIWKTRALLSALSLSLLFMLLLSMSFLFCSVLKTLTTSCWGPYKFTHSREAFNTLCCCNEKKALFEYPNKTAD